ncbi:hypothetical protein, partial [Ralstonia mannitolilytica]|uniref:hypothetical protein n=1 Tax=Ralstonia mannitolilytica TaxID=105219 RepID=UPI0029300BA1
MKTADRTTNARVFALEMPHNKSGKSTPQPKIETREGLQNLPARLPGWDNSDMKQMSLEAPMYTGFELRA